MYDEISCLTKHSHLDRSLHAVIHNVTFGVCIHILDEWKHSYANSMCTIFCCIRHLHSHYAQVESQLWTDKGVHPHVRPRPRQCASALIH